MSHGLRVVDWKIYGGGDVGFLFCEVLAQDSTGFPPDYPMLEFPPTDGEPF
jgi:hypothetical protein